MNIPTDHRVLNEQERLVDASRLFEVKLDRLTQFVPAQSTVVQTALKQARRAAAALLRAAVLDANGEVVHDGEWVMGKPVPNERTRLPRDR